jgi:hypothetical protein
MYGSEWIGMLLLLNVGHDLLTHLVVHEFYYHINQFFMDLHFSY